MASEGVARPVAGRLTQDVRHFTLPANGRAILPWGERGPNDAAPRRAVPAGRHPAARGSATNEPYASLTRRGQVGRLRGLARTALREFGIDARSLAVLRHEHNTTFRVDADGGPYVLRINRPGVHSSATIASEAAWLAALRRDTTLAVPEPVLAPDGGLVVVAAAAGVPEARICLLFRWLPGRFVDARLTPTLLREVGAATATLQQHAEGWTTPDRFERPRVDTMTTASKKASIAPNAAAALPRHNPSEDDAEAVVGLTGGLVSVRDADLVRLAIGAIRETTAALAALPGSFGLIHGDLHQENYFFDRGRVRVIDFDDCGWGFQLYDLMVTISELHGRDRYAELRDAVIEAYAARRSLPPGHEHHLELLLALRRLQFVGWILESREHASFRDRWRVWVRRELDGLAADLDGRTLMGAR
jgi:Ser/Thr protein kinase RdoA (MazF antagonist)